MRTLLSAAFAVAICCSTSAQDIIPIIEVQGETAISPHVDEEVTINAKVTEYFGDSWYMQDEYGAWNGIYVVEETLMVPPNPPWWSEPRQPEVGDELTITGTVIELDGNTQLVDVTLVEQTEFWLATPAGTEVDGVTSQDESLEGTRVRAYSATVLTAPNGNDEWTIMTADGEITCLGIDDEAYPFPGDVYDVYGALREFNGVYMIHVGDIDVISLSVSEHSSTPLSIAPNPLTTSSIIQTGELIKAYRIVDLNGKILASQSVNDTSFELLRGTLNAGVYVLLLATESGTSSSRLVVQ